jgi:rfaE bifunctional protein kinase chain/domain
MLNESTLDPAKLSQLVKSLPSRIEAMKGAGLIVVGDIGLDEYVMGDVRRISPEAPVPVLEVKSQDSRLGLAANVAQNVTSLGGTTFLVAVVGKDAAADEIRRSLEKSGVSSKYLQVDSSRPTTRKLRVMSGHHHMVRVDFEQKQYLSEAIENKLIDQVKALLPQAEGVIIEDYAKGVFSERAMQTIIKAAHAAGKKVFVDPNRSTPAKFYNGADVMTPNREEAVELSGLDYDELSLNPNFILEVGAALRERVNVENIVVTRGREGMTLISGGGAVHMPTFARQVFDVTGAGDTVIAALALAFVSGWSMQDACVLGNLAAGVVVGKVGCVPCQRSELLEYIRSQP